MARAKCKRGHLTGRESVFSTASASAIVAWATVDRFNQFRHSSHGSKGNMPAAVILKPVAKGHENGAPYQIAQW